MERGPGPGARDSPFTTGRTRRSRNHHRHPPTPLGHLTSDVENLGVKERTTQVEVRNLWGGVTEWKCMAAMAPGPAYYYMHRDAPPPPGPVVGCFRGGSDIGETVPCTGPGGTTSEKATAKRFRTARSSDVVPVLVCGLNSFGTIIYAKGSKHKKVEGFGPISTHFRFFFVCRILLAQHPRQKPQKDLGRRVPLCVFLCVLVCVLNSLGPPIPNEDGASKRLRVANFESLCAACLLFRG